MSLRVYQPYEVAIENLLKLWEFICCIKTQEYQEDELKLSSILSIFNVVEAYAKSVS